MADKIVELSWYLIALAIVAAVGLVNLFLPFGVDSSVHILGAKALDSGATLYVDFWDNKAPGLYYFYYLAGQLFGFDEFGIHLFELLWLLVLSICLMLTLRSEYSNPWLSALVPVSSVGIYYATVTEDQLTQLEFLVCLPIYLAIWCAYIACKQQKNYVLLCFCSGLFAGVTVLFKLTLAPILVATLFVLALIQFYQRQLQFIEVLLKMFFPVIVGLIVPLAATAIFFEQKNALSELLWTLFVYPLEAIEVAPYASKTRWITAAAFLVSYFAPWLLFAGLAVVTWFKGNKNHFTSLILVWLVATVAVFMLQYVSWWEYHALLFFLPVAILVVAGIDATIDFLSGRISLDKKFRMFVSALISVPLCASLSGPFLNKAKPLISNTLISHKGIHDYRRDLKVSQNYRFLWDSSRFLRLPGAITGPIYVFGHASVYLYANRNPAHKIPGAGWEFYLPEQLTDILKALEKKRVPYIFMDKEGYKKIPLMRPQIASYLAENYVVISQKEEGIWYARQKGGGLGE